MSALERGGKFKWDGIKHLSDMARLVYLNECGGHHLDVDMGLGAMDLDRPYYHNDTDGNIPLMGAVTAVSHDGIVESLHAASGTNSSRDLAKPAVRSAAEAVVARASDMAFFLNGMIASRAHNPHFAEAIDFLRADAIHPSSVLPSGMTANKILVTGAPGSPVGADLDKERALTVPPYILELQHLTADTDSR